MSVAASQIQTPLTGPRWSSAVHCPRRAYYDATDAPAAPPTDQQKRWWRRGHAVSNAIREEIISEYRAAGRMPRREEPIPWPANDPIGTGHADLYVPSERGVVEITTASEIAPKALQVAGYALNHKHAEKATILYVDPSSFEETAYPIDVESLTPRVRDIEDQVVAGLREGAPPLRVCRTPGDSPAHLCPYRDFCFEGWERPPLDELAADPQVVDRLAQAEDAVRAARMTVLAAEAVRDEARDQLRPLLPEGEEVIAGAYTVKRTISTSERFSLSKARKAGHELPDVLGAFVTTSESERWTVKQR